MVRRFCSVVKRCSVKPALRMICSKRARSNWPFGALNVGSFMIWRATSASDTLRRSWRARWSSAASATSWPASCWSSRSNRAWSGVVRRPNPPPGVREAIVVDLAELLGGDLGRADLGDGGAAEAAKNVADSPNRKADRDHAENDPHHDPPEPVGGGLTHTAEHESPLVHKGMPAGEEPVPARARIIGMAALRRNLIATGDSYAGLVTPYKHITGRIDDGTTASARRRQLENERTEACGGRAGQDHARRDRLAPGRPARLPARDFGHDVCLRQPRFEGRDRRAGLPRGAFRCLHGGHLGRDAG